jgi:hypothetical protein
LSAMLVESKRVNGKPRQRHIGYLGGITVTQIDDLPSRCVFWNAVTAAFDRLGNQVTPIDRQRFEAAIGARVPRPSAKDYATVERERHERQAEEEKILRDLQADRVMRLAAAYRLNARCCAFCGKVADDMIKGETGAMICDTCVAVAAEAVAARSRPASRR